MACCAPTTPPTARVLWEYDTTRPQRTISGEVTSGGSMGSGGVAIRDGYVVVNSGYTAPAMPGNLMLVFAPAACAAWHGAQPMNESANDASSPYVPRLFAPLEAGRLPPGVETSLAVVLATAP